MRNSQHQNAGGSGQHSTAFKIGRWWRGGDWSGFGGHGGFWTLGEPIGRAILGGVAMI
jgi:hypothetical protein